MRKIYSLLLALFLLPLTMVGANQAISKAARSNGTDKSDSRAYVQPDIIRAPDGQPAPSFSVAAWVKIGKYSNASNSDNKMVVFGYGGREHCNDNGCWNFCVDPNGRPIISGWGGFDGVLSETPVSVNEWHYFTAVYDATTMSLSSYLDGVLLSNKVCTKSSVNWFTDETPAIYFGAYCFNGLIDEAHIWNKALTAQEVEAAKSFALGVDGLVGLYTFDEAPASAGTFANQSTQACASAEPCYFETLTGNAAWSNGVVYVISQGSYSLANPTLVESDRVAQSAEPVDFYLLGDLFEEGRVELTATDGTNTYASQAEAHKIIPGTVLTLDAQPAAGYALAGFVEYLNGGEKYFAENTYLVTIADAEVAAYAVSEAGLWDMTVVNEPAIPFTMVDPWGRDVASNPTGLYGAGDAVSYNLTLGTVPAAYDPATVVVKLGEEVITPEDGVYVISSTGDATLTISASEKAQYTVTIEQPAVGGTISVLANGAALNSGDKVPAGTVVSLSAAPADGWQLANYLVDGSVISGSTVAVNSNVTISAVFEEGIEYCQPTGVAGRYRADNVTMATGRKLESIAVTDGTNSVTVQGAEASATGRAIVYDRTSTILSTSAGKTVTMTSTGEGNWMNTFVYVDWDLNGFTTADRVFSNFDNQNQPYGGVTVNVPVPADAAPGNYRVRYIIDWENTDPCKYGQASEGYSKPNDNGEYVIDFVIKVESDDYENARTITVAVADDAQGSVAITNPETSGNEVTTKQKAVIIKATAAAGYEFLNWTDANGNVVSTDATYTYTGEAAASFTANFGFALTFSVGENGSALFTVDGSAVASGVVLAPGTEVEVTATPSNGKFAQVVVNGSALALTANVGTFTMEEKTDVQVSFVDAIYTMTLNIIGDGEVKVTDGGTPAAGPTGTEYTTGNNITDKSLRIWAKPADGGSLISVSYIDEGSASRTVSTREVTAASWAGWYFGSAGKATGNRTITVEFSVVSGIEEIGIDPANGPIEYYNLQGVRIEVENLVPGFYIVRQGNKAAKVFIQK